MALKILSRFLLVLTPLLVGLGGAEFWASRLPAGNAALFVEDPELYVVRKPGVDGFTWGNARWIPVHINLEGMRGDELPATRDPAETRVLCIGDSFTFGGGVETNEAWPQQVQSILGAPEVSGVRVLNGGANGWDTPWQNIYLERRGLTRIAPQVVVLGFNWNDFDVTDDAPQQAVSNFIHCDDIPWLRLFANWPLLRETHLYRVLYCKQRQTESVPTKKQLEDWYKDYARKRQWQVIDPEKQFAELRKRRFGEGPPDDVFWRSTDTELWKLIRRELTRMRDLCAAKGVKLLVAMMPEPTWDGPGRFPGAERLDSILSGLGVASIDLQLDFLVRNQEGRFVGKGEGLWLEFDPFHPTPKGQRIFAAQIARKLRDLGWLPAPR